MTLVIYLLCKHTLEIDRVDDERRDLTHDIPEIYIPEDASLANVFS